MNTVWHFWLCSIWITATILPVTIGEDVTRGQRFRRFLFGSKKTTTTTRAPEYKAIKTLLDPGKIAGSRYQEFDDRQGFDSRQSARGPSQKGAPGKAYGLPILEPDKRPESKQVWHIPIHKVTTTPSPRRYIATKRIDKVGPPSDRQKYCKPGICGSHGRCVELPYSGSYVCMCNEGYVGTHCERNIHNGQSSFARTSGRTDDYCSPNPCMNGGRCRSLISTYYCECKQGYGGLKCERPYL